jgi:hypothetical protein
VRQLLEGFPGKPLDVVPAVAVPITPAQAAVTPPAH